MLRTQKPSVILLDLMMPVMDGFEFIAEFNCHPEWVDIPVIVVTAKHITREDRERLAVSTRTILEKSGFTQEDLLGKVLDLVHHHSHPKAQLSEPRPLCPGSQPSTFNHSTTLQWPASSWQTTTKTWWRFAPACCRVAGTRLRTANNAADAVAMAESERPDLILMDMRMPVSATGDVKDSAGLDAVIAIKAKPELKPIPIIALTGHMMTMFRAAIIDAGCVDMMAKPIENFSHLTEAIEHALKQSPKA